MKPTFKLIYVLSFLLFANAVIAQQVGRIDGYAQWVPTMYTLSELGYNGSVSRLTADEVDNLTLRGAARYLKEEWTGGDNYIYDLTFFRKPSRLARTIDGIVIWDMPNHRETNLKLTVVTYVEILENETLTITRIGLGQQFVNKKDYPKPITDERIPLFQNEDMQAFTTWVDEQIQYPQQAINCGVFGTVVVSFVVDTDGSVCDVTVSRGVHPDLDAEVVRVISSSPKWTPGYQGGKAVKVRYNFPVYFGLK